MRPYDDLKKRRRYAVVVLSNRLVLSSVLRTCQYFFSFARAIIGTGYDANGEASIGDMTQMAHDCEASRTEIKASGLPASAITNS